MKPIILDTRSLLIEYAEYAPLFAFYDQGLKDLVREAVLTRSFNSPFTTNTHPGHRFARGLADKVKTDFEFALDHAHDLFGEENVKEIYNLDFAMNNMRMISQVAAALERDTDRLLYNHLRTRLFEIAQEACGTLMLPRWIGPDLAIFVRTLSQRECRTWMPCPDDLDC